MFIAQPTLSQQIRRLEEIVGTPLLQRRRDGLRLTKAGAILLDASRNVLSLVDHAVSRTRQAAGLGRQRLRVVMPPHLPDLLAVPTASALLSAAAAADVDVIWMETSLDAEFSLIRQRRADAGLGWLTTSPDALAAPLDVLSLGEFEPVLWIPSSHAAAHRGSISLAQIARMAVVHGPRRAEAGTYDAWMRVLRAVDPRFEFTDSPFRQSLPMVLAFAATGDRPTAVLTGPSVIAGTQPGLVRLPRPAGIHDMVRVTIDNHPLTATAALVWSGDLPCPLQQILFQTADGITAPPPARCADLVPVISGSWGAPDTPRNPGPPHQASLHTTTVAPVAAPDSAVSPWDRLAGFGLTGGPGGLWCTHRSRKPGHSRILTPGGRRDRCQRHRGLNDQPTARGGHVRTWHAALVLPEISA
jgi:DNA-binding transcriptional LysR family regulator